MQSLIHELPQLQNRALVQHFIAQAIITNTDQESVQIAVSSLVQHFVYFSKSTYSNPLAAVQWNDDITSALFGVNLTKTDDMSTSQFSRNCLRRSIEEELDLSTPLPLDGGNDDSTMDELLHEAALSEDTAMKLAMNAGPSLHVLDELNGWRQSRAVLMQLRDMLPYLDTNIVDARDGYQRTLLHWASMKGQGDAVEALLKTADTDAGSRDWFGYTPLHYAVRSCIPASTADHVQIVESLLMYDSASINIRDPSGQTPLHMAIQNRSFGVAVLLLRHNAIVETSDYGALLLSNLDAIATWKSLLSKYDDGPYTSAGHFEEGISSGAPPRYRNQPLAEVFKKRVYRGASPRYPGAIELDTGAALILRILPPEATAKDLRPLLTFLKHGPVTMETEHSIERRVWKEGEGREDVSVTSCGSGLYTPYGSGLYIS